MATTCLNCAQPVTENFCGNCGQKTAVHRYSIKHFIEHDVIHSVWHVDSGIFFTVKQLFTRPGHSVREFIKGRRVGYFSFITLLLLVLGISHFLGEFTHVKISDLMPESSKGTMNKLQEFTKNYPKSTLLITIPFYSVFSFLWFKRSKLNLSEHLVLNSYKTAAESLIGLAFLIITLFYSNIKVLTIIYSVVSLLTLLYSFWFYRQFFSAYGYSKTALIVRSLAVIFSYILLSFVIGIIMAVIKFGN